MAGLGRAGRWAGSCPPAQSPLLACTCTVLAPGWREPRTPPRPPPPLPPQAAVRSEWRGWVHQEEEKEKRRKKEAAGWGGQRRWRGRRRRRRWCAGAGQGWPGLAGLAFSSSGLCRPLPGSPPLLLPPLVHASCWAARRAHTAPSSVPPPAPPPAGAGLADVDLEAAGEAALATLLSGEGLLLLHMVSITIA